VSNWLVVVRVVLLLRLLCVIDMLYWRALCNKCAGMLSACKNRCLSFSGHSNRFMLHAAS
jgi:hypothetical protein